MRPYFGVSCFVFSALNNAFSAPRIWTVEDGCLAKFNNEPVKHKTNILSVLFRLKFFKKFEKLIVSLRWGSDVWMHSIRHIFQKWQIITGSHTEGTSLHELNVQSYIFPQVELVSTYSAHKHCTLSKLWHHILYTLKTFFLVFTCVCYKSGSDQFSNQHCEVRCHSHHSVLKIFVELSSVFRNLYHLKLKKAH